MRYLPDTNVIIDCLNGSSEAIEIVDQLFSEDDLYASFITRIELLAFSRLTEEYEQRVYDFMADLNVLPMDQEIEQVTIAIRRSKQLQLPDSIIAATALVADATLVSCDRHMCRLVWPGLRIMTF
jgi:predicted nucleic acid-binding protein